ncbi:hypothetical protein SAMN06265339_1649 [Desulfurobacterium pacificum]|uniref:Cytochrome c7-like domain-containing protein n=1 Tax=Desulfurobacterium pacificum TaxID=240166 RepID=A0ABY1NUW6_9BACT|nr:hypothetical protein [Desulfurobacterium pacificum]SMP18934.1 hypothetical protein SAMN06265339_1649 [Desulfurobacterium pacificum]
MKAKLFLLAAFMMAAGTTGVMADEHPIPASVIKKLKPQYQTCQGCHKEVAREWSNSVHGLANVMCYQCHGTLDNFYVKPPVSKCEACHYQEVVSARMRMPNMKCWTCHPAHYFTFHRKGVIKTKTAQDFGIH